jgi:large subunit ribosomal protein L30
MNSAAKKIKITQVKSSIGHIKEQKRTLRALGITKTGHSITKEDNPSIRGMIKAVSHLVTTQEVRGE